MDAPGAKGVLVGDGGVQHIHVYQGGQTAEPTGDVSAGLRAYLESLAERYRWLELQGIREAGSLRIELDKVYVALKAEPESDYDLRHRAKVHEIEVREAAGGRSIDSIAPTHLEALDAENVRRTHQPRREDARRAQVTEVRTIADVLRRHKRMVLLGGPGSGKTTLGHWLALQLARGLLAQLGREVAPQEGTDLAGSVGVHVRADATFSFSRSHVASMFAVDGVSADEVSAIGIDVLPTRGTLALSGTPVVVDQIVKMDQVERLTFTPAADECGSGYTRLRFSAYDELGLLASVTIVVDVGVHVQVPVSQVDPDQPPTVGDAQLVDLGPARLPVFLRLAHFARELAERERTQRPTVSLDDYLGRDPETQGWTDGPGSDARNSLVRRFLEAGRAVVILDGLDELPEANRRTVLLRIQDFIERFTAPNAPEATDLPWQVGGNQVVVTSRYVGYKLMPVRGGCAHFGIQPMRRPAVEQFARAWTAAVNAELAADDQGGLIAEALIEEIYDDLRPAIRELATNPLLITILATVYWADGRLPDQRAGVYDRVVENLLRIWLRRPECQAQGLGREELLAALEPLAAELQGNAGSNGLVALDRIGELIEGPLALMRRANPADRAFRPALDALLTTIRKQVGLLAEQSSGNYAFFHRTFQEFLAARHMLSDRENAVAKMVERLDDPQWREPLLLALGFAMISPEWGGPQARTRLLADVLAADDEDPLLPRAAILVVNALPDLTDVPKSIVGQVVRQLLGRYAFSQDQPQAVGLREGICEAFVRLRDGPRADLVAEMIAEAIRRPTDDHDLAAAAADVLTQLHWFTTNTVEAFLYAVHRDRTDLDWPIHWALLAALGQPVGSATGPTPTLNMSRLLAAHLPMRRLLETSPELIAFVRADSDWLWLLIALYGGLGQAQPQRRRGERHPEPRAKPQSDGTAATEEDGGRAAETAPIEFCPSDIVHDLADPELSRLLQRHLRQRRPAGDLVETFHTRWRHGTNPAGRADALIGLAALGEDVLPLLTEAVGDRQAAAQQALSRFGWLRALLREPLVRSTEIAARTIPEVAPETHQLDLLRIVIEARTASGGGALQVSDRIPAHCLVAATSAQVREALAAEYWAYVFSGSTDERPEVLWANLRAATEAQRDWADPLGGGWSMLSRARNHLSRRRLPWPQMILAPRCDTPTERYLAMLDGIATAPSERNYLAGYLLGRHRSMVDDNPALLWETLAIGLLRGEEFRLGYFAGANGDRVFDSTCAPTAAEHLASWSDRLVARIELDQPIADTQDTPALRPVLTEVFLQRTQGVDRPGEVSLASIFTMLRYASRVTDPYLRFRALWRLCDSLGREHMLALRLDVLGLIESISDPHDQARAFEWVVLAIPGKQAWLGLGEIFDLAGQMEALAAIDDPENRARAQTRLALLVPERLTELRDAAVESVGQITDPYRRAEVVADLRAALVSNLAQPLDAVAEAMPDPWLRAKAHGRASRLITAYRSRYDTPALLWRLPTDSGPHADVSCRLAQPTGQLAWGLLFLTVTAAEAEALGATTTGDGDHWALLLGPDLPVGVERLVGSVRDDALRVGAREVSVLNHVIGSGRAAALDPLWAHLECTDSGAMAIITRWGGGDPAVSGWKALVQAEAGHLTPEGAAALIELAGESTDHLRLRAALALHGRNPVSHNRTRRWSVQRVGARTVEVLADHAHRDDCLPSVRSTLRWVAHDIHHDDVEALDRWLAEAAEQDQAAASWILGYLESIDHELVMPLLEALPSAPQGLQRTLLTALARLAHCGEALHPTPAAMRRAIRAVPAEVRREVAVLPEGAVTYLKVVTQVVADGGEEARLDTALGLLDDSYVWLDDGCLDDDAACVNRLKQIGGEFYVAVGPNSYWARADKAAAELAENEQALRLLLSWVQHLSFGQTDNKNLGDLLTATYALARQSPDAFAALADPDEWEPLLAEWAETAEWWIVRLSAVRLLGLLRRVTTRITTALRAAMNDISFVQQAAYQSVAEFRQMKDDIIPELVDLLDDRNTAVAAATARLLVSLADAESTTVDRRRILRGLQDAATGSPRARPVHLMRDLDDERPMSIEFVDRLDRILYRAIFELSGF
ncbi:NACHT domain-containing protein [Micromonospora sp. DT229]|uniref:NACHT domain-containing protein n=1 Tax=Micromonospora sp. DT229 TaxID=3393430 RepID=UPI003CF5BBAF